MERSFFDQVLDAFEGFVTDSYGDLRARTHGRGIKLWFGDAQREHYEAQLLRLEGGNVLEVGFHAEHADADRNQRVLDAIDASTPSWREDLGDEPVIGVFLGSDRWRRISELWPPPDPDDGDAPIEIAARLADYAASLEPRRAAAG